MMSPTIHREYGRIRLYEDTSAELRRIIVAERDLILLARKHRPDGEPTRTYNKRIAHLNQILGELTRMRIEKGWNEEEDDDSSLV